MFALHEYVQAERAFVGESLTALSDSRGGIVGHMTPDPMSRPGTTQVTLESGEIVEFDTAEIGALMTIGDEDVAQTNTAAFVAAIDDGAGQHHDALTKWVLANLEKLSDATGNTVDASGKSLFEAIYEAFEKIELTFEEDGEISKSFAFVVAPDVMEKMKRMEAEMTEEQRNQLDRLIDRKRKDFFAGRRRRELS